jgi:Matrixin
MRRAFVPLLGLLTALPAGAADFRLLDMDGLHVKWGAAAAGTGAEVSYGFAAGRRTFTDAINCRDLAPLGVLAPAWDGDDTRLHRLVAAAFAMWGSEADLRFRAAAPGEEPDILIGTEGVPRGIAFANVWHDAGRAAGGIAPLVKATICFNPTVRWLTDEPPEPVAGYDLRTVLAHEIGHAIGLDHPGATGALMGYQNQGDIEHLMPGDVAGAVALYGPARAP